MRVQHQTTTKNCDVCCEHSGTCQTGERARARLLLPQGVTGRYPPRPPPPQPHTWPAHTLRPPPRPLLCRMKHVPRGSARQFPCMGKAVQRDACHAEHHSSETPPPRALPFPRRDPRPSLTPPPHSRGGLWLLPRAGRSILPSECWSVAASVPSPLSQPGHIQHHISVHCTKPLVP